jgi:hypothetical protein
VEWGKLKAPESIVDHTYFISVQKIFSMNNRFKFKELKPYNNI